MSGARSLCLSLELSFDEDRVVGRLEDEQGNDWRFSSWLDLLTLIERMPATTAVNGQSLQWQADHDASSRERVPADPNR
jgi:hypothetical protein